MQTCINNILNHAHSSLEKLFSHYYMSKQYDTFLTLSQLFNSQIFSPLFNLDNEDNIIFLSWRINNAIYEIKILNNGNLSCNLSSPNIKDKLFIDELELIFNCINLAYINYGTNKSRLWRHVESQPN